MSGISGAGKTSVVERTVELLGDAARLHFDDYLAVSTCPSDLKAWVAQGADLEAWKSPRLAADLSRLRSGKPIHLPADGRLVEPAEVVLIEEPFGKLRPEMAQSIDLAVFLDVPAEVLLARRLLRRLGEERDAYGDGLLDRLQRDLRQYLKTGREIDALGADMLRQAADLVLDGMQTVDELAGRLVEEIRSRRNGGSSRSAG